MDVNKFVFIVFLSFSFILSLSNGTEIPTSKPVITDEGSKDEDFIDELPNQPENVNFRQYSGNVIVDSAKGRTNFYYFVEASGGNATSKPLFLWLVGADAGCSPLAKAFEEVGPFEVKSDGQTLIKRASSWNQLANIIFLEAPAGVGFAKTNDSREIFSTTDTLVIKETQIFMLKWLQRFSEFSSSDLYLVGQDYIGVLGPRLARSMMEYNEISRRTIFNIKGLLMGNPTLDVKSDQHGLMEYYYGHSLTSQADMDNFNPNCNTSDPNTDCYTPLMNTVDNSYYVNANNLYAAACPDVDPSTVNEDNFKVAVFRCTDQYVAGYLNMPFVQQAMHQNVRKGMTLWTVCNNDLMSFWPQSIFTSLEDMKEILSRKVRVMIYSGDLDLNRPLLGTRYALMKLNLTITTPWRAWFHDPIEIGGYTESYKEGLTYATVRNCGRNLGYDQPQKGFLLIQSFIQNIPLPTSPYFPHA